MNIIKNYGYVEINGDVSTLLKTKIFNNLFLVSAGTCNGGHFEQDKLQYNTDFTEDENLQNFIDYLYDQSEN